MSRLDIERTTLPVLRWVVIVGVSLAALFPFYYMVMLSFVPIEKVLLDPGRLWPDWGDLTLGTYADVLRSAESGGQGFGRFMLNSAVVAISCTLLTLAAVIPAAYAVSRLEFRGRSVLGYAFLAVYLFPAIVIAIPMFVGFSSIGLGASLVGLVVVYIALTVPVAIHMLRTYLVTIPASLDEAAMLDGCSRWTILRRIVVPLAMPTIMSTALYIFMIAWNELLFALLFLVTDRSTWTVSLGLSQLSNGIEVSKTVLMAGSVLLTIPVVLLYGVAERALTDGLTSGAEKG